MKETIQEEDFDRVGSQKKELKNFEMIKTLVAIRKEKKKKKKPDQNPH